MNVVEKIVLVCVFVVGNVNGQGLRRLKNLVRQVTAGVRETTIGM